MSDEAPRRRRGRPTRCTPAVRARVCEALRAGLPLREAGEVAGIGRSTLFEWRARGEEGEAPFADFLDRTRAAEAEAQAELLSVVRAAAVLGGDWRAAIALLGRRWPDSYAERREITGPEGGAVELDLPTAIEVVIARAAAAR